jgi:uncharacterized protein (TIGR02453 family)
MPPVSGVLPFLADLSKHNDKAWFETNRPRFAAEVQEPVLAFITELGPRLQKISKHVTAVAKKSGGSMSRIFRDVRFSRDKSPYHTHISVILKHASAGQEPAPGFYLHLAPGGSFLGTGLWQPEPDALAAVRKRIVEKGKEWTAARDDAGFRKAWKGLAGESLKRPPQGIPPEHPLVEDLKRKDFVAFADVKDGDVTKAGFMEQCLGAWAASDPLMRFLCAAMRLPW